MTNNGNMKRSKKRHLKNTLLITAGLTAVITGITGSLNTSLYALFSDVETSNGQTVSAGTLNNNDSPTKATFTATRTNPTTCTLAWGELTNPQIATGYLIDRFKNTGASPSSGYIKHYTQNSTEAGSTDDTASGVRQLPYRLKTTAANGAWSSLESNVANCAEAIANDDFNRTTTTDLGKNTSNGFQWNNDKGTWTSNGNKPSTTTPAASNPHTTINYNEEPNVTVSADVASDGDAIIIHKADDGSYYQLRTEATEETISSFQITGTTTVPRYEDVQYYKWSYDPRYARDCAMKFENIGTHRDKADEFWPTAPLLRKYGPSELWQGYPVTRKNPSDYPAGDKCTSYGGYQFEDVNSVSTMRQPFGSAGRARLQLKDAHIVNQYTKEELAASPISCIYVNTIKNYCDSIFEDFVWANAYETTNLPGDSRTNVKSCPNYWGDPTNYPNYTCTNDGPPRRENTGTRTVNLYGWVNTTTNKYAANLEYVNTSGNVTLIQRYPTSNPINNLKVTTSGANMTIYANNANLGNVNTPNNVTATKYGIGRTETTVVTPPTPHQPAPIYDYSYQSLTYGNLQSPINPTPQVISRRVLSTPTNVDNFKLKYN